MDGKIVDLSFMKLWGFIAFSRTEDSLPIIDMKMSYGKPCLDPVQETLHPS